MSPRKPPGEGWESFVDRQIREARERGEFDDLRGHGRPLPDLHRPHDESWWIRRKMQEEGLSHVPPGLQARKEREEALERIARARTVREVRQVVAEVNVLIRKANREALRGPATTTSPLDEEEVVAAWREQRSHDRP